jgi:hypothetical protein
MIKIIAQIILAAIITERLLEGLHKFYWTKKLKTYLVGDSRTWTSNGDDVVQVGKLELGILPKGALREYVRCKFCQSWAIAWVSSLVILLIWEGWSLHWLWIGLVAGWLANKLHDAGEAIKAIKFRGLE